MFTAAGKSALGTLPTYIEDVFSTWLYTGVGSTQTITNGIDLSTKGGLVWVKSRDTSIAPDGDNLVFDTVRSNGNTQYLVTNTTAAQYSGGGRDGISAWNTNGFTLSGANNIGPNTNTRTYASWTFRKQAKFFDVVTYTGDGVAGRTIPHTLGSVPGMMIVKCTSTTGQWAVYHRSLGGANRLYLDSTGSSGADSGIWNNTDPTSTVFTVGSGSQVNAATRTYVAYLFAHDAGGFGAAGTDNVISCGSYVGNGSTTGPTITLGYEPQWIMVKSSSAASNWIMLDNMRGVPTGGFDSDLYANLTYVGSPTVDFLDFTATGFIAKSNNSETNASGATYIYIAIRRGPMRTPTSGTSVFVPVLGTGGTPGMPSSFTVDSAWTGFRTNAAGYPNLSARLIGDKYQISSSTAVEQGGGGNWKYDFQTGFGTSAFTSGYIGWLFRRAPGFMDVVCYTGTGSNTTQAHNLGVAPELIMIKERNLVGRNWGVYSVTLGNTKYLFLNTTNAEQVGSTLWNNTSPTASVFTVGTSSTVNLSASTYVAYLFATLEGVSKVGSYTGTGALQTINCGFASGSRFVLIKRTDLDGDWYLYDSTRGITSGNDPYILLNVTAAEVTNTNYVDTASTGFQVTAAAPAGLNANGGTYIFLAIA